MPGCATDQAQMALTTSTNGLDQKEWAREMYDMLQLVDDGIYST